MTPIWGTFGGASARGFGRGGVIPAVPTAISVDFLIVAGGGGGGSGGGGDRAGGGGVVGFVNL